MLKFALYHTAQQHQIKDESNTMSKYSWHTIKSKHVIS